MNIANLVRRFSWIIACVCFAVTAGWLAGSAHGQMSGEMRQLFAELKPRLDSDLQIKVQDAVDNDRNYLELTVNEFERLRDHPDNPFEGWDKINTAGIKGLIRVQFETTPVRSRVPGDHERQAADVLDSLVPVVQNVNVGTVRITDGKAQIALGMVVTAEGHVCTKYSEIAGKDSLFCKTREGERLPAELLTFDECNDIAVLKIEAGKLPPVEFARENPEPGAFVISVNADTRPLALGVCSNSSRSLVGNNQAFLGVKPVDHAEGVLVAQVTEGSSASLAGLRQGDIVLTINGQAMNDVQTFVNVIRQNAPGDKVVIDYLRDGNRLQAVATLAGRDAGTPVADRFKQMETFGAIPSKRRSEFPRVFQHDTPLVPEECGGPVINLDGQVVGMNIARGGRVASYAIPADHLQQVLGEMIRPSVASRDID